MHRESRMLECFSALWDEVYREIVAFANTDGGAMVVGAVDPANFVGLKDVDETFARLSEGIRNTIFPDVTPFVRCVVMCGKVIVVEVGEGSEKPYSLKSRPPRPSGVFIRRRGKSVLADPEQIRALTEGFSGDEFESRRCPFQMLTFKAAEKVLRKHGVGFPDDKYLSLAMGSFKGYHFTNLSLVLSDYCDHATRIAVYERSGDQTPADVREFKGSLLAQLERSLAYLKRCSRARASVQGPGRVRKPAYPEAALREALLYAAVNRSYAHRDRTLVNVDDRRMEFFCPGGLRPGLALEDILGGVSQPRNRRLAEILFRLHGMEAPGPGIQRIRQLYRDCPAQPEILVTGNSSFKLVLPSQTPLLPFDVPKPAAAAVRRQALLDYLDEHGEISDEGIRDLLHIGKSSVYLLVRSLREDRLVSSRGWGKDRVYVRTSPPPGR